MSRVGYSAAWLEALLYRAKAERKLVALFDVAQDAAVANGRARILRHDFPLTKGLQALLGEVEPLVGDVELRPLLVFLTDAGVPGPLDEAVRAGSHG